MASKNINIRLDEEQAETLKKEYGQISTAIQLIVEPFNRLRKLTMAELKPQFTKEELTALIDSQNGTLLTSDFIYNKQFIIAQLEDFETFERGISRHNADRDTLMKKVSKLSHSEVYLLIMDIQAFWNTGANLEEYLNT